MIVHINGEDRTRELLQKRATIKVTREVGVAATGSLTLHAERNQLVAGDPVALCWGNTPLCWGDTPLCWGSSGRTFAGIPNVLDTVTHRLPGPALPRRRHGAGPVPVLAS